MRGVLATGAAAALLSLGAGTSSAGQSAVYSQLVNVKSGKCLSLAGGGSTANNTSAIQYTCGSGDEMYWAFDSKGLLNFKNTDKCLSTEGGGTANGTQVLLYTCNSSAEQGWTLYSNGQLVNAKAQRCLSISGGGSTANNASAILWDCYADASAHREQQWAW
ncbi:hypothetical protein GCM10009612_21920 [Streptomyces beijiangensis]